MTSTVQGTTSRAPPCNRRSASGPGQLQLTSTTVPSVAVLALPTRLQMPYDDEKDPHAPCSPPAPASAPCTPAPAPARYATITISSDDAADWRNGGSSSSMREMYLHLLPSSKLNALSHARGARWGAKPSTSSVLCFAG